MTSSAAGNLVAVVRSLGFSELEAEVYCELLQSPGSTGYGIGKAIRKSHANVYQGLNALERKGAVCFEEGSKKTYTAVPPLELIDQLRRQSEKEFSAAARALKAFEAEDSGEDRFFQLSNREQVFARARALLREAKETILFEAHPGPTRELHPDIISARDQGVGIAGVVYSAEDLIEGTKLAVSKVADELLDRWTGEQLTLVVDGRQFLLAFLHPENGGVIRAVWASSSYVAMVFHNAMASDVVMHTLEVATQIGSINHYLFGQQPPTCGEVMARGKRWGAPPKAAVEAVHQTKPQRPR